MRHPNGPLSTVGVYRGSLNFRSGSDCTERARCCRIAALPAAQRRGVPGHGIDFRERLRRGPAPSNSCSHPTDVGVESKRSEGSNYLREKYLPLPSPLFYRFRQRRKARVFTRGRWQVPSRRARVREVRPCRDDVVCVTRHGNTVGVPLPNFLRDQLIAKRLSRRTVFTRARGECISGKGVGRGRGRWGGARGRQRHRAPLHVTTRSRQSRRAFRRTHYVVYQLRSSYPVESADDPLAGFAPRLIGVAQFRDAPPEIFASARFSWSAAKCASATCWILSCGRRGRVARNATPPGISILDVARRHGTRVRSGLG